ncbi:MAG: fibronectin type III domain-containing protein [Lachnospiraceae bacterium]|nr:fibronectin type III domain-containing protein [Lachnospiraceae bacterium]
MTTTAAPTAATTTVKTAAKRLAAPVAKAEPVSQTYVKISWKGVSGADGYCISMKTGNKWKTVGSYKSTTRWVRLHNMKPNTTYTFKVRAYTNVTNQTVWGSYSKPVTALTAKRTK